MTGIVDIEEASYIEIDDFIAGRYYITDGGRRIERWDITRKDADGTYRTVTWRPTRRHAMQYIIDTIAYEQTLEAQA